MAEVGLSWGRLYSRTCRGGGGGLHSFKQDGRGGRGAWEKCGRDSDEYQDGIECLPSRTLMLETQPKQTAVCNPSGKRPGREGMREKKNQKTIKVFWQCLAGGDPGKIVVLGVGRLFLPGG